VCRLCSDGASLQERLLRLPFYSHCWPENAKRDQHLNLAASSAESSSARPAQGLHQYQELDSSRNTSAINLAGLRRGATGNRREADVDLPLGVFLYQNYRYVRQ
jgi:hypothetical protein